MAAGSGITFLASSGDQGSADCVDRHGAPDRPAGGQLPVVVAVGDRRRRHQPRADARQPDRRPDRLERHRASARLGRRRRHQRAVQPARAIRTGRSQRNSARSCPTCRCSPTSLPATPSSARPRPDCINSEQLEPVADGGRHQRGDAAARRRLRARRPGAARSTAARTRLRQPAALQARAQPDAARARCSPTCSPTATTSALSSPATHRSLGCCTAGRGFDRASGWGSVNLAGLATRPALPIQPPMSALSLPAPSAPGQARGAARDIVLLGGVPGRRLRRGPDRRSKPFGVDSGSRPCRAAGPRSCSASATSTEHDAREPAPRTTASRSRRSAGCTERYARRQAHRSRTLVSAAERSVRSGAPRRAASTTRSPIVVGCRLRLEVGVAWPSFIEPFCVASGIPWISGANLP